LVEIEESKEDLTHIGEEEKDEYYDGLLIVD